MRTIKVDTVCLYTRRKRTPFAVSRILISEKGGLKSWQFTDQQVVATWGPIPRPTATSRDRRDFQDQRIVAAHREHQAQATRVRPVRPAAKAPVRAVRVRQPRPTIQAQGLPVRPVRPAAKRPARPTVQAALRMLRIRDSTTAQRIIYQSR